jgi:plasmid maintenance system antidote protein VapI
MSIIGNMYKLPKVQDFKNALGFFSEFYQLNQIEKSHRAFAEEIGWPASLVSDIMHQRKNLTLNRAVEFAHFFKFNGVEQEYLVMLALQDVDNIHARNYARDYLKTEGTSFRQTEEIGFVEDTSPERPWTKECDILILYLEWCHGQLDFRELAELLPSLPSFQNEEKVRELLQQLYDLQQIDSVVPPIKTRQVNLVTKTSSLRRRLDEFEMLKNSLETHPESVSLSGGAFLFPAERLPELMEKRDVLVNWIAGICLQEGSEDRSKQDRTLLYMNLSIYELLHHDPQSPQKLANIRQRQAQEKK